MKIMFEWSVDGCYCPTMTCKYSMEMMLMAEKEKKTLVGDEETFYFS